MHQEGLISRVPRLVRGITLREFAKYNGDVQACLKGLQKQRLGGEAEAIDKTTRKRKWVESQEAEAKAADASESEPLKAAKSGECIAHCALTRLLMQQNTARVTMATPKKVPGAGAPGTSQRARMPTVKTPGIVSTSVHPTSRLPS